MELALWFFKTNKKGELILEVQPLCFFHMVFFSWEPEFRFRVICSKVT